MTNAPPVPVILNERAGAPGTGPNRERIEAAFRDAGVAIEMLEASGADELSRIVQAAVAKAPQMIVAAGGDGTISAVASQLAGTHIALGVLPLGTLNHFARDLRIPPGLTDAVRIVAARNAACVDVGEVNGRVFINNSSIGLYPRMVRHRRSLQHRLGRGKWSAMLRACLVVLHRYPLLSVVLSADGVAFARRTPLVFVGNNAYAMDGLDIGTRARLDAGVLSLYIPRRQGRWGMFSTALRSLLGLRSPDDFDSAPAREIVMDTRRRHARVAIDGEVASLDTPLRYRIRAQALHVIVPRDAK